MTDPTPRPSGPRDAWTVAMLAILPLLALGSCVARGALFRPQFPDCLILAGPTLAGTALSLVLVRRSRIGAVFFLLYGLMLSAAPELYLRPQDRAFYERVEAMKDAGLPTGWVAESRGWPRSNGMLIHSDDEYWFMTD